MLETLTKPLTINHHLNEKQTNEKQYERNEHLPTSLLLFSLSIDVSTFALATPLSWRLYMK